MNITTFKSLVKPANEAERKRLDNLHGRYFRFLMHKYSIGIKNINESNIKMVWNTLNKELAADEKLHRRLIQGVRESNRGYVDYSDLAYNGVTDDF